MSRRTDTRDPRSARLAALRVLHAADVRQVDLLDVLQEELERAADVADDELSGATLDRFAVTLLHGLGATLPELDERISRTARGWRVGRMPVVDRNVLRLAVHELLTESTPVAVVMDEAVRMATELSTDDSGRYVNGVLVAVVKELGRDVDGGATAVGGPVEVPIDAPAEEESPPSPPNEV